MVKVGVIGVGSMGKHHVRIYSELKEADLVGVYDTNEELAKKIASQFNIKAFKHIDSLLREVEAVSIATHTLSHKKIALRVIEAGVHLLVEKPLAENSQAAEEIALAAEKKGIKLTVGHVERFNPVIRALKDILLSEPAQLITIQRVGPFPPRVKDVGIILDIGIHDIDIIQIYNWFRTSKAAVP